MFNESSKIIRSVGWVFSEISPQGFWIFFGLSLTMILSDPSVKHFFSRHLPLHWFLALAALFCVLYLHRISRSQD